MKFNGDDAIRKAMEDGQFDNLPGKGKPLNLDENPFEDPEWRMANRLLKESGFSLPWIETRKEIDAGLEKARQELRRAWSRRVNGLAAPDARLRPEALEAEWKRAVSAFREQIEAINKRLVTYNLDVPSLQFQRMLVSAEREIEKICSEDSPGESRPGD